MKRTLVGLVVAGSLVAIGVADPVRANSAATSPLPGIAVPYCPDPSQQGLNRCAGFWLQTAAYYQDLIYADLRLQLELPERVQLAIAEEHWQVFHTTQCRVASEPYLEGSIYPLIYGGCMAMLTNDRTADLQQWGNPSLSQQQANERMETLLDQLHLTDSDPQAQWQAYRNSHCDFEAGYRDDVPDQYEQCILRLTTTQIQRLEALKQLLDL